MSKRSPTFLFNKDPWLLAEEIPDSDIFFFQIPMSALCSNTSYPFLKSYRNILTHYKKFHMDFYMGEKDSNEVAESIVTALLKRPNFGAEINLKISEWSYKLIDYAQHTASLPLSKFSNSQLWELYAEHDRIHTKLYTYGWIPVAVDLLHNNFTRQLKSYLYGVCDSKQQAEDAFIILTTPSTKTIVAQEREQFLNIYKKFHHQLKKPGTEFLDILKIHSANWGHLGYIYSGTVKPFGPQHYLMEMRELSASGISPAKILNKEKQQLTKAKRQQTALHRSLGMSKQYIKLFAAARDFALTKLIRRHAQLKNLYLLHTSLLPAIAKKIGRTRFDVQCMLYGEVEQALLYGKILSKKALQDRFKECVLYTEKDFEAIYAGKDLKRITKNLTRKIDTNITELAGQTAQPGYAKGIVKLIFRAKDIHKMNKGDILVSIATDPDVVPAMKLAGAIVTEQGGITSHAAIVSRELGIPCIIGTKIATKIFKDGDLVEVDANKGTVKKL